MSESLAAADQLRLLARSYHQGCGWEANLAVPQGEPPHGLILPHPVIDTAILDELLASITATDDETATNTASASLPSKLPAIATNGYRT